MAVRRAPLWGTMIPVGLITLVLGAWVVLVPLVGPSFGFGLGTDDGWSLSREYWILSFAPGFVAFAAGLMMLVPLRGTQQIAGPLALLAGLWLVLGPTVYPVFSSGGIETLPGTEGETATRWVGYFYGPGVLIVFLAGLLQGTARRRAMCTVREEEPVAPATVVRDGARSGRAATPY